MTSFTTLYLLFYHLLFFVLTFNIYIFTGANRTGVNQTQPKGTWVLYQVLESSTRHQITLYDDAIMNHPHRKVKGRDAAPKGTMQNKIYITPAEFGWSVDIHQDTLVVGSPSAGYKGEVHNHVGVDGSNLDNGPKRKSDYNLNQHVKRTGTISNHLKKMKI